MSLYHDREENPPATKIAVDQGGESGKKAGEVAMETGARNRRGRKEEGTRSRVITSVMETRTRHTREEAIDGDGWRIRLDLLHILGVFPRHTYARKRKREALKNK